MQTSSGSVVVGSHVWIEHPEVAWLDGEVVEINGEDITVLCTTGEKVHSIPATFFISYMFIPSFFMLTVSCWFHLLECVKCCRVIVL